MGNLHATFCSVIAASMVAGCATTTTPASQDQGAASEPAAVDNETIASDAFDPRDGIPSCPALDDGDRLTLHPSLGTVDFITDVNYGDPAFIAGAVTAQNVASYFENAQHYKPGQASYDGIGPLDDISIGQMQWNWKGGAGTLTKEFFKDIPEALLDDTNDAQLKQDLAALALYAKDQSNRQAAEDVVTRWQAFVDDADSPLAQWLRSEGVKAHQDALVEKRLGAALQLAKTWMHDRGYSDEHFERTLVTFANFNIHTGLRPMQNGLRDLWAPQLEFFASALDNDRNKIFAYVTDWMRACENANVTKKQDAFGVEAWGVKGNIEKWSNSAFIAGLTDEQVDLFAYSFLYATRSDTQFGSFPKGYSQLDVLQRAGVIVLDVGTALGADWDPSNF